MPYNGSAEVTQGLLTKSVDFTLDGTVGRGLADPERAVPRAREIRRPAVPAGAERPGDADGAAAASTRSRSGSGWSRPRARRAPIVAKIQQEVAKALADPAIKAKADAAGLFPATSTPAEFARIHQDGGRTLVQGR